MPVTRSMMNAAQGDTAGGDMPIDGYEWRRYGHSHLPEGSRKYYRCKYTGCRVKMVEYRDQFNSVVKVVYKGDHKHDPPNGVELLSSEKSLKTKSIEVVQIVHSEIKQRLRRNSSESSVQHPKNPDQKDSTGSKSLSASKPVKIPTDSYGWIKYGQRQGKSPVGSRSYYKCNYRVRVCRAKKVEFRDQFDSIINVVYKGEHKHDPPKKVILKECEVISTAKSLERKSTSTPELKEHPIEVAHVDDSEITQRSTRNNSESSVLKHQEKLVQKDTTGSESLSASESDKIPIDGNGWIKYGQNKVKNPEGSRSYYRCKYSTCRATKVESCDQFNSIINVVYKGEHEHDPPKRMIVKGGEVVSNEESPRRKLISASGLKEHLIEIAHIDDSEIKQRLKANSSESFVLKHPNTPDKDSTGYKSLSASEPVKIPTDSYAWIKYGQTKVKSPEGSRSYYKCEYSTCRAKKVELCDQFNSLINVVYKNEHKHDPVLDEDNVILTAKLLKRKSISTPESKEYFIEVVQVDDSELKQRNGSESYVFKHPKKPPKFIVHAAADMKISADGYKWRKYGQKMVKGYPHPRNCYKCTYAGCTVKKHVQKAVDGSSQVIITYKGLHNHNIPAPNKDGPT
ncbi:uncharacterized protein LOC143540571 isoform X2 [Bidens hawaiensis]|uniref:uncharacterized protein LOC143540571 isoform X2 n=1 Tax=Bidens hawaiensis TaxID=980011 RepID=UPI00404B4422